MRRPFVLGLLLLAFWTASARSQEKVEVPHEALSRELVIGTKQAPPFATKDGSGSWEGLSIDLWRHVADRLGLRYRFQEETLSDLIAKTARGELDAAIAAISVTAEREGVVDFTQPYYSSGLGIAVSRNGVSLLSVLRGILTLNLLRAALGVLVLLFLVGVAVWLLERQHTDHFGNHGKGLRDSIMWAAMTAAGDSGESTPRTFGGKLVWLVWLLASVLLISSLTAVMTTALTTSRLQSQIQEVGDLRRVRTGTVADSAPKAYLDRAGIAAATFPDLAAALEALPAGRIDAVVYDRPLLIWTIRERFPTSLTMTDVVFSRQNYAIALPPVSALRIPLNEALLREQQADWWQTAVNRALGEN